MELKGAIYIILSCIFFSISTVLVKLVSSAFNSYFVSVSRFIIGISMGILILVFTKKNFKIYDKKSWILRGITGSVSMVLYYMAIEMTSSGRATLLNNLYVIFLAVFEVIIIKERMRLKNIISIVLCLTGVSIVFYDGSSYPLLGNLVGIASGIILGVAVHYTKRSSEKEHPAVVYMAACLFGLLFTPFSSVKTQNITLGLIALLLFIGVSSFLAQLFMTSGYRYIAALKGSLISYVKIPLTILLGMAFGEEVGWKFAAGTIVLIAGLLVDSNLIEKMPLRLHKNKKEVNYYAGK